jgi:NAD(P)-dependent dehydrogenase (short-subunit alcohol dehydrogenase family)
MKRTSSNVNSNVYSNVKSNMCDPSLLEKDLTGKVALITGANTGIGLVTATQLAKQGATVVIACRDVAKGVQAAKKASPSPSLDTKNNVECMQLDLASLESVRTFAKEFQEKYPRLDFLVLNAGVMACPKSLTKDGFELQFGTNHLGHFLLANLLLPTLKKSAPSRVITLSSCAHDKMLINPPGTISFEDPNWETRRYSPWPAYSQSKLANMLFARELAKRCEGTGVTSYSLHPGFVQSSLTRHLAGQEGVGKKLFDAFAMSRVSGLGMIPVWEGTQMSLSLILTPAEKLENGAYFAQKDSPGEYEGGSETANTAATLFLDEAKDEDGEVGRRLWEMSAKLVQLNELE